MQKADQVCKAAGKAGVTMLTFPDVAGGIGRVLKAELNAKSLRRCVAAIEAAGPESVAVVLSGRLEGDTLAVAGMVVQPKTPTANRTGIVTYFLCRDRSLEALEQAASLRCGPRAPTWRNDPRPVRTGRDLA